MIDLAMFIQLHKSKVAFFLGLTFYSDSSRMIYQIFIIATDAGVVADVDHSGILNAQMGTPIFISHSHVFSHVIIPVKLQRWVAFGEALQYAPRTNLEFSVFQLSDFLGTI